MHGFEATPFVLLPYDSLMLLLAWPGKISHLDEPLSLQRPGRMYVIDDLLPQANWSEGHAPKVPILIEDIERRGEFITVKLAWASRLMLLVRKGG